MPRKVLYDGLSLRQAYKRLGELTDRNSERFNQGVFETVKVTANSSSRWSGLPIISPEEMWEATKAYFAIGFCGGLYVGIQNDHEDTTLGDGAPILLQALKVYHLIRFGKPDPSWFREHRHLFSDLSECVSREIPKEI